MAKRRSREVTEQAILHATIAWVAEAGVDGFTLSDVAKRAGVNRALIYHYFDDRTTLIDKATEHVVQRALEDRLTAGLLSVEQTFETFILNSESCRFFLRFLMEGPWATVISDRFSFVVREAERLRAERGLAFDASMAAVAVVLSSLIWTCAREQSAAMLDVPVAEADRRFLAALAGDAGQKLRDLLAEAQ